MTQEQAYTDEEYLSYNPFQGDESELSCRTVSMRKARNDHLCYSLDGKQDHNILAGEKYRYERALVDRSFLGSYRICLKCMDRWINDAYGCDDD